MRCLSACQSSRSRMQAKQQNYIKLPPQKHIGLTCHSLLPWPHKQKGRIAQESSPSEARLITRLGFFLGPMMSSKGMAWGLVFHDDAHECLKMATGVVGLCPKTCPSHLMVRVIDDYLEMCGNLARSRVGWVRYVLKATFQSQSELTYCTISLS